MLNKALQHRSGFASTGQFVSCAFVVLLRKSIPQRATYKLPLNLALQNAMNNFFTILCCFFLVSCQAVKYQSVEGYSSKITFEAFEENQQCNGEGIVFKAVKSKNGTYYAVKKSPFYLEPGTYEFVYSKARQVIGESGYCTTEEEIWVRIHCNECKYVEYGYTTVNLMSNSSYLLTKHGELKKL